MSALDYTVGRAGAADVAAHLALCDGHFVPPLSSRVALAAYAAKLAAHATCFEAWDGPALAALVAVYCNDRARSHAFVSSVSVLPAWQGHGLARRLLGQAAAHAAALGFAGLELEVDGTNTAALGLYRTLGYTLHDASGPATVLRLPLERKQQ